MVALHSLVKTAKALLIALLIVIGIVFAFPVVAVGGWVAFKIGGAYVMRTDFDPDRWRQAAWSPTSYVERGNSSIRMRMLHDLMDRYDLGEMSRAEVTALLGESDHAVTGNGVPLVQGWDLVYNLGPERSILNLDEEWLAIRFVGQRVEEFRIIES